MDFVQRFIEFVKENKLFPENDRVLLAVSGGVDSVVLCELCKRARYDFAIAHCNFRLRDRESERDKTFVKELAKKYGVDFFLKEFDTEKFAREQKLSIQEAARNLRYDWFRELLATSDYRLSSLLTAHHADDNIETVLMNFCRGTGLTGLTGIPAKTATGICRPLLGFWKQELLQFAKENKLEFVEDSSNASSKYSRNLFRNEIIPLISKVYPEVKTNLQDNIDRFREVEKLYGLLLTGLKKKLVKAHKTEPRISIQELIKYQNRALIYEVISDYGFGEKHIDELIKLGASVNGRYIQSPTSAHRIIKFNKWFIVSVGEPASAGTVIVEESDKNVAGSNFDLQFSSIPVSDFKMQTSNFVACLDAGLVTFPLILRQWKQGDYFYPLGMTKKKKLARFFIDQKLSKTEKEKAWVLETNKKIIWIVGMRIDERFKVTGKTKRVLQIEVTSRDPI